MAAVTDVTIAAGAPTVGTGTVATLSKFELPASTAPLATDEALIVSIRPDSPGVITTGTAGTPSAVVLSVQGVASGTNIPVVLQPTTAGGCTISSTLIASGTNATPVKASAGQLYKIEVTNNSANIGYLKLYNTAGTPTAGSGTPVIRLMCPGNASGTGAFSTYDNGVAFGTGIGFTFTGGIADNDTTSVAASAFIVNLYYK